MLYRKYKMTLGMIRFESLKAPPSITINALTNIRTKLSLQTGHFWRFSKQFGVVLKSFGGAGRNRNGCRMKPKKNASGLKWLKL